MAQSQIKTRVLFPIGAKLVIIISILLLASMGAVISLVSVLSSIDVRRTAEYNNFTINRRAGSHAETSFNSIKASVLLYLDITSYRKDGRENEMENNFFNHNQNIAAIEITQTGAAAAGVFILNKKYLLSNNINENTAIAYFNDFRSFTNAARADKMILFNASPFFNYPLLCGVFSRENETVKVLFSPADLSESFGVGANTSFIVTDDGYLLLHPDNDLVLGGADFSNLPIVKTMRQEGSGSGMQISFTDETGVQYFGAYYQLAGTDAAAFTIIPHNVVFEAVRSITFQNIFLTGVVVFIAIMFIWFFSKTIASPVRSLADAALQIEGGDFGIKLKPKARDEIGLLTESFGKMTTALNIFGRFTNKDIAVRAMRGEIKPGGLPKHATIFFSDIRGFTEKSENFTNVFSDNASDRIVAWLNEYFTQMVDCVEKTGGIVDKFIGDAVMAHWGTAYTAGNPAADAFNGVKCALMMRIALYNLNKKREKNDPGSPEIVIGAGLNTGIVTAGQLGSEQRMEYTVIGDPVNLASRTEALNKPLGTDILITEDTWNLVGDKFITEEMPPVTVKGKEKPVRMFAVVNLKGAKGPQTLAEVREMLGITPPDISKVNTDAEEEKFKIQSN
ncbi:MAG: HAMP domain-containing protein [Treponema sp.]|jgi:adenylate cyclase|nr:HAMP domain-containing protein [Treponema sp.]